MKRLMYCFSAIVAAMFLAGSPHNVDLAISNPTPKPLDVQITIKSSSGVQAAQVSVGAIQPTGNSKQQFQNCLWAGEGYDLDATHV